MHCYLLITICILVLSAILTLFHHKSPQRTRIIGSGGVVVGCLIGLVPPLYVLFTGTPLEFVAAWQVPFGSFHIAIDALSALFLMSIFILAPATAIYATAYLKEEESYQELAPHYCFFALLIVSMILVVVARNIMLFLLAWELMSITSYMLVIHDKKSDKVRGAGVTYLVATQIGAMCLTAMFILLAQKTATFDLSEMSAVPNANPAFLRAIFVLAIIGFGTKAGFIPMHVWLPEAHPAAPSHVSAIMSGVMIKIGLYGLIRILLLLGPPAPIWGITLITIGLISGIFGITFSLTQGELKRILAYSSIENIGIISTALGLSMLSLSSGYERLAVLSLAGAIFHIWNHTLIKGLLFLCAGFIIHVTGIKDIDRLGGLMKHIPAIGSCFLFGCLAIAGLPPLNGFMSEFLIYYGSLDAIINAPPPVVIGSIIALIGITLIGVLAACRFVSVFGIMFLGEDRSNQIHHYHTATMGFKLPIYALTGLCVLITLASPFFIGGLLTLIAENIASPLGLVRTPDLSSIPYLLLSIVAFNLTLVGLFGILFFLRHRLLAKRSIHHEGTWDCGYIKPTSRIQYSGSSFTAPTLQFLRNIFRASNKPSEPLFYFPKEAISAKIDQDWDSIFLRIYNAIFKPIEWLFMQISRLQDNGMHVYILYIIGTLFVLLIWHLGI